jgi:hypothetical protein
MAIVWYCDQLISLCPVLVPSDVEGKSADQITIAAYGRTWNDVIAI